jgi:hypothetical protein
MNPTQLHPAFAENFGMNTQEMNDTTKVTIVRRRVVYEELVVDHEEFNQMNEDIESREDFCFDDLDMNDIGFPCFVAEETEYIAFPGDVTSFTDDAISFLFENKVWSRCFDTIEIAS